MRNVCLEEGGGEKGFPLCLNEKLILFFFKVLSIIFVLQAAQIVVSFSDIITEITNIGDEMLTTTVDVDLADDFIQIQIPSKYYTSQQIIWKNEFISIFNNNI